MTFSFLYLLFYLIKNKKYKIKNIKNIKYKKNKEEDDIEVFGIEIENCVISYFTVIKSHLINYVISFYDTLNILIFIFLFYLLK